METWEARRGEKRGVRCERTQTWLGSRALGERAADGRTAMCPRICFRQRVGVTVGERRWTCFSGIGERTSFCRTGKFRGTSLKGGNLRGIQILLIGNGLIVFWEAWKMSPVSNASQREKGSGAPQEPGSPVFYSCALPELLLPAGTRQVAQRKSPGPMRPASCHGLQAFAVLAEFCISTSSSALSRSICRELSPGSLHSRCLDTKPSPTQESKGSCDNVRAGFSVKVVFF